jgi:hypothetical protein
VETIDSAEIGEPPRLQTYLVTKLLDVPDTQILVRIIKYCFTSYQLKQRSPHILCIKELDDIHGVACAKCKSIIKKYYILKRYNVGLDVNKAKEL